MDKEPRMGRSAFTEFVAARCREMEGVLEARIQAPLKVLLKLKNAPDAKMGLENVYRIYCQNGNLDSIPWFKMVEQLASSSPFEMTWDTVKEKLMVKIENRERTIGTSLKRDWDGDRDLCIVLVVDFPTHMMQLSGVLLDEWGVDHEEAWELGWKHLRKAARDKPPTQVRQTGVWVRHASDGYDASMALLPKEMAWAMRRSAEQGCIFFAIPDRDVCLMTWERDMDRLAPFGMIAKDMYPKAGYQLSQKVYAYSNGDWANMQVLMKFEIDPRTGKGKIT